MKEKICENCKWYRRNLIIIDGLHNSDITHGCYHPKNMKLNLVTGVKLPKESCENMRSWSTISMFLFFHNWCGEKGRWFEEKEKNENREL